MIPVLDGTAMREADRITIDEVGLPPLVLMERAAAAVADVVEERFGSVGTVTIVCGPGNNGGDGLAVGRQLHGRGVEVVTLLLGDPGRLSADAAAQRELAVRSGTPVVPCRVGELPGFLGREGVIVDALFGTGLDRPLDGSWAEAVGVINAASAPVVAVDMPSGLLGGRAIVTGPAVEATVTVTFGAPKVAHVLPPACWHCGEVAVADIGIPSSVLEGAAVLHVLEAADVAGWLPARLPDAHKGHFGHLVIVAGRLGRAGAAALAARAAVVAGAGLVTVATPRSAVLAVQSLVPEAMVDPLPEDSDGVTTGEGLEAPLARATAVAVGPGLGVGEGPRRLLARLLGAWQGPLLLDADALTLVGKETGRLQRAGSTVLTPHPGELARLAQVATEAVAADRVGFARRVALASGAVVTAKGARTVIVGRDAGPWVVPTGGPGLASGGAGDVLTGMTGALLAQGLAASQAAAAAAYLHGAAADRAARRFPGAIPAGVLADYLPFAEREVRGLR